MLWLGSALVYGGSSSSMSIGMSFSSDNPLGDPDKFSLSDWAESDRNEASILVWHWAVCIIWEWTPCDNLNPLTKQCGQANLGAIFSGEGCFFFTLSQLLSSVIIGFTSDWIKPHDLSNQIFLLLIINHQTPTTTISVTSWRELRVKIPILMKAVK